MFRRLLLLIALAAVAVPAAAADPVPLAQRLTPEQLHETGLDTLTPAQLARLDELLRAEVAAAAPASVAPGPTPAPGPAAVDPGRFVGMADGPIQARIEGTVDGWAAGDEFRLDNGQVWKVLKGEMRLRAPLVNPPIRVVPGIAGRWFLEVDPDLPKARVYRID